MPTHHRLAAGLALLLLSNPSVAMADPLTVTSGTVQVETALSLARMTLAGSGFNLSLGTEDFLSDLRFCAPCDPGPVSLSASWQPTGTNGGSGIVNGVTIDQFVFGFGTSGTFTTAPVTLQGASPVTVAIPFTFTGVINGFSNANFDQQLFSLTLVGGGLARARFSPFVDNGVTLFNSTVLPGTDFQLEYRFSETAATPEPATWILTAGPILAGWIRRRMPG